MNLNKNFIVLTVLMLVYCGATTALMCYSCNSEYDPRCGEVFDDFSIGTVNCSKLEKLEHLPNVEPTLCRKTTQKVYGKIRVVRGCGYITDARDNGECMRRSGTHDVQALYCSCTNDLCNHGTTTVDQQNVITKYISTIVYLTMMFVFKFY